MRELSFDVDGTPTPQGSKIPGVSSTTGKAFVREQGGRRLKEWRIAVIDAAKQAMLAAGWETRDEAVRLVVTFRILRPKSVSHKKRQLPTVPPDLDKLVRAVGDALESAGVVKSDARIVSISASKRYCDSRPGASIAVQDIYRDNES